MMSKAAEEYGHGISWVPLRANGQMLRFNLLQWVMTLNAVDRVICPMHRDGHGMLTRDLRIGVEVK